MRGRGRSEKWVVVGCGRNGELDAHVDVGTVGTAGARWRSLYPRQGGGSNAAVGYVPGAPFNRARSDLGAGAFAAHTHTHSHTYPLLSARSRSRSRSRSPGSLFLKPALPQLGHALSEDDAAALFATMDEDGDGNISKSEFGKVAGAFQLGSEFSAESMAGGLEGMAASLSLTNAFAAANVFSPTLKMGTSSVKDNRKPRCFDIWSSTLHGVEECGRHSGCVECGRRCSEAMRGEGCGGVQECRVTVVQWCSGTGVRG